MKRAFAALVALPLIGLSSYSIAQQSRSSIQSAIESAFPSTGRGAVTAAQIRTFLDNLTNSIPFLLDNPLLWGVVTTTLTSAGTGYVPGENVTLSIAGATVQSPVGLPFYADAIANIINTKVVSATVAAGGSGCSGATATLTGTTGTGGGSSYFTATAPISGGAITNPVTITAGGQYQVNPTSLTNEPVTGSSCSGAQLNLTMGALYAVVQNPGSYSVPGVAGTATQASTSGSGTGATFTVKFGVMAALVLPLDQSAQQHPPFNAQGTFNTRFGYQALGAGTSANQSTAIGWMACALTTTGSGCHGIGNHALGLNTTGVNNTAVGRDAMRNNTTGSFNTAIGGAAGTGITSGSTGDANIFIGTNVAENISTGGSNIFIGSNTATSLLTGSANTIIGVSAAQSPNFGGNSGNVIIGRGVASTTLGGNRNILIGTDTNCDIANATSDIFRLCASTGSTPLLQGNLAAASLSLTVNGSIIAPLTTPASSSATCTQGTIEWDASFIYICTATDTWKRVALSTF